jgi:hypothetical protein
VCATGANFVCSDADAFGRQIITPLGRFYVTVSVISQGVLKNYISIFYLFRFFCLCRECSLTLLFFCALFYRINEHIPLALVLES